MKTTLLCPRGVLPAALAAALLVMLSIVSATGVAAKAVARPIPVILDTDIGDDTSPVAWGPHLCVQ